MTLKTFTHGYTARISGEDNLDLNEKVVTELLNEKVVTELLNEKVVTELLNEKVVTELLHNHNL